MRILTPQELFEKIRRLEAEFRRHAWRHDDQSAPDPLSISTSTHAESHTVASHSDTTATGAEMETLTGGSDADALHIHGEIDTDITTHAAVTDAHHAEYTDSEARAAVPFALYIPFGSGPETFLPQ